MQYISLFQVVPFCSAGVQSNQACFDSQLMPAAGWLYHAVYVSVCRVTDWQ
jgi:hypothetical protein